MSMDDLLSDAVRQLLADKCTPQVVRDIEAGAPPVQLWSYIEAAGIADALVSEHMGGAGLRLPDVFTVFELCGAHALPVPLAETMFARALLAQGGIERPAGSIAIAVGSVDAQGGITCDCVRSGRVADWILVSIAEQGMLLPNGQANKAFAGFPLDASLRWPASTVSAAPRFQPMHDVRTMQACIYAAQLAGALMVVFQRTLQYANDRSQFGRSIGKFQAIQHQLAFIAEHVFAARMAGQIGCQSDTPFPDRLLVAVAKARTSEAALEVAALSHSIHGAIGFTEEFDLQLFTRRLHLWRQAGGSESYWHSEAGASLVDGHSGPTLDLLRRTSPSIELKEKQWPSS